MLIINEKIGKKSNQEYLSELSKTRETLKIKVEKMKLHYIEDEIN